MPRTRANPRRTSSRTPSVTAAALAAAAITALLLPLSGSARPLDAPVNKAPPTISGSTVKGQTLTAGTGTWEGAASYAFQWQRCDDSCADVAGATNTTYELDDDDVGKRIRVRVTATSSDGASTIAYSQLTDVVTGGVPPSNSEEPRITGSPVVGQRLSASTGTWSGDQPITFAYQWVRCGIDGGAADGSNCSNISGATGTTYVLTSAEVGSRIRIRVTATNSSGAETVASNPTAVVTSGGAPRFSGEPRVTGSPVVGQRLSASTGTWSGGQPMTFTYQWVRCGTDGGKADGSNCPNISGATGTTYVLTSAEVGSRIRVRVTARNSSGSQTAASNPTDVVRANAPVNTRMPTVSGSWVAGQTVTVNPGTWSGMSPITFAYQWLRCNSAGGSCALIQGATSLRYRLGAADVGHKIRVNVTARNSRGSTTVMSNESAIVASGTPSGIITLPTGERSISVASVPRDQRLIVDRVVFTPRIVGSRREVISIQVRVKDTRGYVVRGAMVFVRSTPLVTRADQPRRATATNGYAVFQMVPRQNFPTVRRGAVQFFVKAYRVGDPPLAGVAGYRLVQVRIAR